MKGENNVIESVRNEILEEEEEECMLCKTAIKVFDTMCVDHNCDFRN